MLLSNNPFLFTAFRAILSGSRWVSNLIKERKSYVFYGNEKERDREKLFYSD